MLVVFAIALGVVFGAGVHLVMRRDLVVVAFGISLIGTAVNMLILVASRAPAMSPALVDHAALAPASTDPVAQAFVLTAIVIGFAAVSVVLAIARRSAQSQR